MKNIFKILVICLFSLCIFTACQSKKAEEKVRVFSFYGENQNFKVENGVIVLDGKKNIFYCGKVNAKNIDASNITYFSKELQIRGEKERKVSFSAVAHEEPLKKLDKISENTQIIETKTSSMTESEIKDLKNKLYYVLKVTDENDETYEYELKLEVKEVTITK